LRAGTASRDGRLVFAGGGDLAPLTPDQDRLVALGDGATAIAGQHRALVLALRGDLDVARLRRALETVASDHDVLRARLEAAAAGGPRRVSFQAARSFSDLIPRAIGAGGRADAIEGLVAEPLDLAQAWSRAALWREGEREHLFCLVLHRIGADAASLVILARAIAAAYDAGVGAPASTRADPESGALAAWLSERARQRAGAGWPRAVEERARPLRGDLPALDLPSDRGRPAIFSGRGGQRSRVLDAAAAARLRALAAERQVTIEDLALTAFVAWIQRRSGVADPPIGVALPRAGAAVGPFTAHGVMRLGIDAATPLGAAIPLVADARAALARGPAVDREELIRALAPPADPSRTPIYQVAFEVEPPDEAPASAGEVTFERVDLPPPGAATDLTLRVRAAGDGLRLGLEYSSDIFDDERAAQMLDGLATALEALPASLGEPIGRLPVMSPVERARTLAAVRARPYDPERHAFRQFEAHAARAPDATAVVFRGRALSYRELNQRANRVAHRLIALGVGRDALVGIYCERSTDLLVATLAAAKAGGAYLPLDPSHPPARTLAILEDAAPRILVTQAAIAARAPSLPGTTKVLLDDPTLERERADDPGVAVEPDALAYVIFTSGSTGRPKGVAVEHRSFTNFIASMARAPGLRPHDRVLSVTTLSFDIAGLELFLPLAVGGSVEIADAATCVDGARLAARLADPAVTVMQATPATFRLLLDQGWPGKPGLKILCGGEALQPDLIASLLARAAEVWNMYGPTETTVWSTVRRLTDAGIPVSIGGPIDNTSVYVLGPLGEPVPFGAAGEIYIGGDGVARGYWDRVAGGPISAQTAQRFLTDPFSARPGARMYRTGDIGRFLADGSLTCLGRADFQVKIRGFRIETGEIEKAILDFPGVAQAVVTAWERQPGDKRLVAYVVYAASRAQPPVGPLRAALERTLPPYMVPSLFVRLDDLPRNAVGKIDRRALPPPTDDSVRPNQQGAPPADDLEAQIHASFGEVLGLSRVGVDESFFDVGGESILAARLARALETSLGVEVPLSLLFEAPTIRGLAARVRDRSKSAVSARPRVVVLRRGEGDRRLFCVCGVALYSHLARVLPADLSVLGVLVPEETSLFDEANLRRGRATLPSVEKLASLYVEAIRDEQPEGPYRLLGVSFGGVLAYEAARQLAASGQTIAFLGLLDALLPQAVRGGPLRRVWWGLNRLLRQRARLRASLKLYSARLAGDLHQDWSGEDLMALRDAIHDMAVESYSTRMGPFDGAALLVSARDRSEYRGIEVNPRAGWEGAVRGGLTSFDVGGHHLGILQPPNVNELASKMAPHMNK
jgi:amino acid adenylation domain-containing protein